MRSTYSKSIPYINRHILFYINLYTYSILFSLPNNNMNNKICESQYQNIFFLFPIFLFPLPFFFPLFLISSPVGCDLHYRMTLSLSISLFLIRRGNEGVVDAVRATVTVLGGSCDIGRSGRRLDVWWCRTEQWATSDVVERDGSDERGGAGWLCMTS
jgi:hypothetical protein